MANPSSLLRFVLCTPGPGVHVQHLVHPLSCVGSDIAGLAEVLTIDPGQAHVDQDGQHLTTHNLLWSQP